MTQPPLQEWGRDVRNMVLTGLAAAAGFCGLTNTAQAETLGIKLSKSGFGSAALLGPADPLIVSQSFGTFSVNTEVNTVVNNPLAIDLSSNERQHEHGRHTDGGG